MRSQIQKRRIRNADLHRGVGLEFGRFLLVMLVFAAPGVMAASLLWPTLCAGERATRGVLLAWAFVVIAAGTFGNFALGIVWPVFGIGALSTLVLWWMRRRSTCGLPSLLARPTSLDVSLLLVLLAGGAARFAAARAHDLPSGWDPTFHLILVRKLLSAGALASDWRPLADVPLNYPLGSHALVALISTASGISPQAAFSLMLATTGVLMSAQVAYLTRRATGDTTAGTWAAMAFAFWCADGSIDYLRWGGLPNALAICFLLGLIDLLIEGAPKKIVNGCGGMLLGAIFLAHHHVSIVAVAVLAAIGARCWKRDPPGLRLVFAVLVVGVMLAAGTILRLGLRVGTIGDTGIMTYQDYIPLPHQVPTRVGVVFSIAAIVGITLIAIRRVPVARLNPLIVVTALALASLFIAVGYGYRSWAWWRYGVAYAPFTPSRFLTDLAPLLAIFGGVSLAWAQRRWNLTPARMLLIGILGALTLIPDWRRTTDVTPIPSDVSRAYRWIDQFAPANAIVQNADPWAAYLSGRRVTQLELPVSEPRFAPLDPDQGSAELLAIRFPGESDDGSVLWRSAEGFRVVRIQRARPL
jgi:hypothetical protein